VNREWVTQFHFSLCDLSDLRVNRTIISFTCNAPFGVFIELYVSLNSESMKNMLTFKRIDLGLQAALWLIGLAGMIWNISSIGVIFIWLAPWQLFSALLHLLLHKYYYQTNLRIIYLISLLVYAFLFFVVARMLESDIFYYGIFILAFLMALLYSAACYLEMRLLRKKLFVHLR
jgi:hypothetical protein